MSELEKKIFKGEDKRISNLLGEGHFPVQFVEPVRYTFSYDKFVPPNTAIVKGIAGDPYYKDRYYVNIWWWNRKNNCSETKTLTLSGETKVRVLSGTVGQDLLARFKLYVEEYPDIGLAYGGRLFGSDPEMFVERGDGRILHAFDFLPKKLASQPLNDPYWDGFQAEFNINPTYCIGWFGDSIQNGLLNLHKAAVNADPSAKLSIKNVIEVPREVLENGKEEHVELGCAPSMNIYGIQGLRIPHRQLEHRFAGGHLHWGIGKRSNVMIENIVKTMDKILGVATVSLFAKFDNPIRRQFYGLPGEYRLPAHGLEYRVLSNAWMMHPLIMNIVLEVARKALMVGETGIMHLWNSEERETVEIIANCDVEGARKVLKRNEAMFKKIIGACNVNYYELRDQLFDIFMNGAETLIKEPDNIERNWELTSDNWVNHCDGPGKNVAHAYPIIKNRQTV